MTHRVAITGLGCVSGLGQGVAPTWNAAAEGRGAIRPLRRSGARGSDLSFEGPAAFIEGLDTSAADARFGPRALAGLDPLSTVAVIATLEAINDAGLDGDPVLTHRTAITYGCGSNGNATLEEGYERIYGRRSTSIHPQSVPRSMISAPASHISMLFGVRGPAFVLASACASSAHAIGEAMHMIRAGRAEVAITGGADACLELGSWSGWTALRAMATDTCRPFSADRKGMVLGEGAATLILENYDRARARGATIYAELVGYGATSDAFHITQPQGDGAEAALRFAHADAGLSLETPLLYSSHGTGTALNDSMEARALRKVYGAGLDDSLVIATKSAHGHLVGGAGAIELLLGVLALKHGLAPPVLNRLGPDPECDVPLALSPTAIDYDAVVSSSFAFGGLNAVLIAKRPDA